MVQAEPDDGLHMLQGDGVLALVGSQGAGGLICGDVATYAVHISRLQISLIFTFSSRSICTCEQATGVQHESMWQHGNAAM